MKLSAAAASLVVLLSVGGVAASQDLLLRGSETSRQLRNNRKCKNFSFDVCGISDGCSQCCECECDGTVVEAAKPKCSEEGCESDEAPQPQADDCDATCSEVCDPAAPPNFGSDCTSVDDVICGDGSSCSTLGLSPTNKCEVDGAIGTSCSETADCLTGLTCDKQEVDGKGCYLAGLV
mmetsp:Transcript_24605/g.49069  ORF Transcript_24605/g.49069 Transcript_24605/m.49069 type:complete len:178 (-) Transcript_24605:216-749(-)|eukprot:CAMPEP_0113420912 /NCGR_PEP_ID=MMETSP0013_2-20120614/27594_1 /TAXON_ID=2843 ORGANISM="Skeletonema costatum, Strain 1716" /NCGR_SAMPLE_ID=MMETSP0013_2 /ASSEMBLY_ACC=CAM_ASM_000158 /LENGTH=177 /DNA_ID=CAMNT_0000308449 /DNA_START=66 /DNA_END=599 /DNA_ORIENTATION=- /assembly_acc=CAM_ASM_000158